MTMLAEKLGAERLDSRLHPFKADVAATYLEGQVEADRFVDGVLHKVIEPLSDMMSDQMGEARISQALFGERFMVYQSEGYWAWGQLLTDGYVGWISKLALALADDGEPTHRLIPPLTRATNASIKVLGTGPLPMGAQVHVSEPVITVGGSSAPFALTDAGAVPAAHLVPLDHKVADWVAVAQQFLHAPYVWGGRSAMGLDCSALIQLALQQACTACPRDSDMQEKDLGVIIDRTQGLQRGDLVFWPGHVGVLVDEANLLHANAYAMATAIEPLSDVEGRVGTARVIKRLDQ